MIKLILANKPKYVTTLEQVLEKTSPGSSSLLKQPSLAWFLLADGSDVVGVAYVYTLSDVRMYVNVAFTPDNVNHKQRKQAGKDLIKYLTDQGTSAKLETLIPVPDKGKLRYFSQLGFKREGTIRSSILLDGNLSDQTAMGLVLCS